MKSSSEVLGVVPSAQSRSAESGLPVAIMMVTPISTTLHTLLGDDPMILDDE